MIIHSVLIRKDTEFMKFILFYHLIPKMVLSLCFKFNSNKLLNNITIFKLSSLLLDYINSEKRVSNKEVFDKLLIIPKPLVSRSNISELGIIFGNFFLARQIGERKILM